MHNGAGHIALGIDIGGTSVKAALCAADAEPTTATSELYEQPTLDELTRYARAVVARLLDEAQQDHLIGVGLAVPGPLSADGRLEAAANLPCLIGVDLRSWLCAALHIDCAITVMTDAHAAARGEHARDPFPGRALYLAIGTGVGGAVLDDGEPLVITRGTPGHLGHIDVSGGEADAPSTPGAGRGALEAYIGFRALQRAAIPTADPDWPRHERARPALAALARALRIFLVLYRPTRLVLMGGVGLELGPALPLVRELVADQLSPAAPDDWDLMLASGDRYAAALGAAAAVHSRHEHQGPRQTGG
jgi:glucokinase